MMMLMMSTPTRVIAGARPSTSTSTSRHARATVLSPVRRATTTRRRAGGDAEDGNENEERTTSTSSTSPEYGLNPLTGEPLEEKGQMTAIVTGIVSVALAVGYLGLVQVMDSRDMLPPPPEALGDGSVDLSRVGR
jgi:hypothetical protein